MSFDEILLKVVGHEVSTEKKKKKKKKVPIKTQEEVKRLFCYSPQQANCERW
jgi:hypothetical protein